MTGDASSNNTLLHDDNVGYSGERQLVSQKRKPVARSKREMITRLGLVTGWDASVYAGTEHLGRACERKSMMSLEIRGELTEPVCGVVAFQVTVFPEAKPILGNAEIPSIGSIIAIKPVVHVVVPLADREFQLVIAMAELCSKVVYDLK